MEVVLSHIAKHFGREMVFSGVDLALTTGSRTAILGPNGSGKSTLLQVIGGAMIPTEGSIEHRLQGRILPQEEVYRHVAIAAPYLGLYEDLSLREVISFHARFKPLLPGITPEDVVRIAYLDGATDKQVVHFSSGMKQRLKLALAILSATPLLLLDEPTSNLDAQAIGWYRSLVREHVGQRTLVVASNHLAQEHEVCDTTIEVGRYKP